MAAGQSKGRAPLVVARAGLIALYLITPVLALLHWKFDLNLRLPGMLNQPGVSVAYYGVMTLLGIMMAIVPRLIAELLATLESAINLAINASGLMLWYVATIDDAVTNTGSRNTPVVSAGDSVNVVAFLISLGTILVCYLTWQVRRHGTSDEPAP